MTKGVAKVPDDARHARFRWLRAPWRQRCCRCLRSLPANKEGRGGRRHHGRRPAFERSDAARKAVARRGRKARADLSHSQDTDMADQVIELASIKSDRSFPPISIRCAAADRRGAARPWSRQGSSALSTRSGARPHAMRSCRSASWKSSAVNGTSSKRRKRRRQAGRRGSHAAAEGDRLRPVTRGLLGAISKASPVAR